MEMDSLEITPFSMSENVAKIASSSPAKIPNCISITFFSNTSYQITAKRLVLSTNSKENRHNETISSYSCAAI